MDIDNQYDFFREVRLDTNGFVIVELVTQTGAEVKPENAKEFYKQIALNSEGELKIFE